MAIARGAGTEILRAHNTQIVDSTNSILIFGVQHHIYTVLSIIVFAQGIQAAGNYVTAFIQGYDNKLAVTNEPTYIFQQDMQGNQTFVWDNKFSMNGFEPTDFAAPMDDASKQDLIADQGGALQKLFIKTEHADDNFDVVCTFLDQNNA